MGGNGRWEFLSPLCCVLVGISRLLSHLILTLVWSKCECDMQKFSRHAVIETSVFHSTLRIWLLSFAWKLSRVLI